MSFQRFSSQGRAGVRPSDLLIVVLLIAVAVWVWWQGESSKSDGPLSEMGTVNGPEFPARNGPLPDEDAPSDAEIHPEVESGNHPGAQDSSADETGTGSQSARQNGRSHGHPETANSPGESGRSSKRDGTAHRPLSRDLHIKEGSLKIANQQIRDLSGRIVYRGTIDLKPTIDRIERGEPNRHRNDGSIFQNRERRIPAKGTGYYKEYVHPTAGESGPGPQRVIIGQQGEVWYTPDHYRTFIRINSGEDEQ